jgi:hypothetical protein
VKAKNNVEDNNNNNGRLILSHLSYLSKRFGSLTYEDITKKFIKEYGETTYSQILVNLKYENRKAKLLYNYLACQLLVYREENAFQYVTDLINRIRKYL